MVACIECPSRPFTAEDYTSRGLSERWNWGLERQAAKVQFSAEGDQLVLSGQRGRFEGGLAADREVLEDRSDKSVVDLL